MARHSPMKIALIVLAVVVFVVMVAANGLSATSTGGGTYA